MNKTMKIRRLLKRVSWILLVCVFLTMTALLLWPVDENISAKMSETSFLDMHVHIAGIGSEGSGCYINPAMKDNFRFSFFLRALDVNLEELETLGDSFLVEKLSKKIAASKRVKKAVILAMDGVMDQQGMLDKVLTQVYVPNEYVAHQASKYDNLLFGASINPHRSDALEKLEWAKSNGAILVKWIPSIMKIDPSDATIIPFYEKMVALGLPLLSHAGQERAFAHAEDAYCDPLRLVLPLKLGVTVIAAHMATTGTYEEEPSFNRILPLLERYPNLYSDISSLTQINKRGYLFEALKIEGLSRKLIYGSDWPLQFVPLIHPVYHFPHISLTLVKSIAQIENQWDRDVALKEAMGVPEDVFLRSAELLLPRQ